jgi:hypothetical protein
MIKFTVFLLPDGRRVEEYVERGPDVELAARELAEAGCRFEAERLRTGEVSLEVVAGDPDDDPISLALVIVRGGGLPAVWAAVDQLVREAMVIFIQVRDTIVAPVLH